MPPVPTDVLERAKRITALVMDVDGVLTDGRMVYDEFGGEVKAFDVQDGTGLVLWRRAGLKSAIITGKETRMIKRRAKDLRIDFLAQKALNKLPPYEAFLRRHKLAHQAVCAIGDDLLDLPILRRCGLAISVPNAVDEVKAACHFQTAHHGGRGAVREVIDLILKATGAWETVVKPFYL